MQTRYRAAATALLLTATAGMAATGGAAQASGSHHTGAGAAKTLTITIKNKAGAVKLSDDRFRPGNTIFKLKNIDGKDSRGLVQIFRLRAGYELSDAFADFGAAFGSSDPAVVVPAINRIDDNIVFYGGMEAKGDPSKVAKWAVKINKAGTYYVANLDKNALTTFKARGDKQRRALPDPDGFVNAVTSSNPSGNDFKAGKHNAASGWMRTTNHALEPHFVDLEQVKKGTTEADIAAAFQGGPDPSVKNGGTTGTGVISPGHTFLWGYDLPKGTYAALCFWPSKSDGMPHALMGMHDVFKLG
jgi:hypothetical protein